MAALKYLVKDVDRAIAFYTQHLGFAIKQQMSPCLTDAAQNPVGGTGSSSK